MRLIHVNVNKWWLSESINQPIISHGQRTLPNQKQSPSSPWDVVPLPDHIPQTLTCCILSGSSAWWGGFPRDLYKTLWTQKVPLPKHLPRQQTPIASDDSSAKKHQPLEPGPKGIEACPPGPGTKPVNTKKDTSRERLEESNGVWKGPKARRGFLRFWLIYAMKLPFWQIPTQMKSIRS